MIGLITDSQPVQGRTPRRWTVENREHERQEFLSTVPPGQTQRRLATAVLLISVAFFAAVAPFARVQLPEMWAFIPLYQSAVVINDLITAVLLFGQFAILRSPALLLLAGGYVFTAFIAVAHTLTFPRLFAPTGLLGAGPQSTAWLYMFWHGLFALVAIAFALLNRGRRVTDRPRQLSATISIAACIGGALIVVCALTLLATSGHDLLPTIMQGDHYTPAMAGTVTTVWALNFLAFIVLWRRRLQSVLHLWVAVSVCAWLLDIALAAMLNAGRFDLGFYVGRIYGLLASSLVLLTFLLENGVLYARLARALSGERTERLRVQEKTTQLNDLNESLERRVAVRTAELDASNRELQEAVVERARAEAALRQSRDELHEIATVSSTAREQERARIARELHDELAQALTVLNMDLGWLRERIDGAGAVASKIAGMQKLVDGAVAATRRIASALRPLMLDDLGLVPAARWLAQSFTERHGIRCDIAIVPPDLELVDPQATAVFRIMQESLANVARHAGASLVEVKLSQVDGHIQLSVRDNGRGFDLADPRKPNSFGLVGLRERAYLVGGEIRIDSAPGRGTRIEVRIPLPREALAPSGQEVLDG